MTGPNGGRRGRDLRSELDQDDGALPTSWRPEVGDTLVGVLLRYDRGSTPYGPQTIAHIADEESGEIRGVWILHEVLRQEFAAQRPRPGERLGIKRLPDGDGYKRYRLVVDRAEPLMPDFEASGPAAGTPPAARRLERPTEPPERRSPGAASSSEPGASAPPPLEDSDCPFN